MVRHVDLRTMIADKYSTAANTPAVEECTLPDVEVVERATVQKPDKVYATLEAASQINDPTIIVATSREVAARLDRFAKQPFHSLTKEGIRPYRRPTALKTEDDRHIVQRSTMCKPTVELPADGGVNLTWDDTTLRLSAASAIGDHAAEFPDGVLFATDNGDDWKVEHPDGSHVETVDSKSELEASYSLVRSWFEPTKVSYRADITIHYLDQTPAKPEDELQLYQPAKNPENNQEPTADQVLSATVDEFIEQATVSADGHIPTEDLFECYQRWLPDGLKTSRSLFARYFSKVDYKIDTQYRDKWLCDRTWRYAQPNP